MAALLMCILRDMQVPYISMKYINTYCRHFADDIFKYIFLNENVWIALKISLRFVRKVRINNIPALVQIMAPRRTGAKPLSEPMVVSLLTHICVTRRQCRGHGGDCMYWIWLPRCQWHLRYRLEKVNPPITKKLTNCRPFDLSLASFV